MTSEAQQVDLVVVGGGPAGSSAAAIAARAGLRVLLLEAGHHPRPHVGESLLPGVIPVLQEMGALEAVESAGFEQKTGSTHWGWGRTPAWDLWFEQTEAYDHAWLVERSRFDEILVEAARRSGAEVREGAAVRRLSWEGERLRGAEWSDRARGARQRAEAAMVVDASGRAALVARDLGLGSHIEGLKHRALWAHFEGCGRLPAPRTQQALFVAEGSHWIWFFPLSADRSSIGIVQLEGSEHAGGSVERVFDDAVEASDRLRPVLGPRARRAGPVRIERDWSYRMSEVAGPGWMLAGDAAGFIDPVLSTGVLLAMHSGWHAARMAVDVAEGRRAETSALQSYREHYREMFGDLLRIVRFFYEQNLHKDGYFWESKRILLTKETELKPQKAFLVLTSGLVDNLAFDEKRNAADSRRSGRVARAADMAPIDARDPDELGFVCIHMRHLVEGGSADLFFLIEPADPADPALFRTRNWHLSCLAPKYDNDPILVPALEPHLRALADTIRSLDDREDETLAAFWRRARHGLAETVRSLPPDVELVRVFGE